MGNAKTIELSGQIFEKILKYQIFKFHINPLTWEPSCAMRTDERTDRQTCDEANSRFSAILRTRLKIIVDTQILSSSQRSDIT